MQRGRKKTVLLHPNLHKHEVTESIHGSARRLGIKENPRKPVLRHGEE